MVGEYSLKLSALKLKRCGVYVIVKIWKKSMTDSLTQLISDKAVCGISPATPGLLKTYGGVSTGLADPQPPHPLGMSMLTDSMVFFGTLPYYHR